MVSLLIYVYIVTRFRITRNSFLLLKKKAYQHKFMICAHIPGYILFTSLNTWMLLSILQEASMWVIVFRLVRDLVSNQSKDNNKKNPHYCAGYFGGPPGVRTLDTLIKSQVLCQLS